MTVKIKSFHLLRPKYFVTLAVMGMSCVINQSNFLGMIVLLAVFALKYTPDQDPLYLATKSLLFLLIIGVSFLFPVSNTVRYLFGIFLLVIVSSISKNWKFSSDNLSIFNTLLFSCQALYLFIQSFPERFLQFMVYGYDNAFHFSLFRIYFSSQKYLTSASDFTYTDFGLFRSYPGGFYAISSFLSSIITGSTEDPKKVLSAYFLVLIFICLSTLWISFRLIQINGSNRTQILHITLLFLAFVSTVGVLLTNGYPPYLYSLLILLLIVLALRREVDLARLITWISVGLHLLLISQPLIAMNLIFVSLIIFCRVVKKLFSFKMQMSDYLSLALGLALGFLTLFMVNDTSESFGVSQLLVVGGVQSLSIEFWLIQSALLPITLYTCFRNGCLSTYSVLIFSLTLPFVFLMTLTLLDSGSVGYYAIKQAYVWSYFLNLAAIYVATKSKGFAFPQSTKVTLSRVLLVFLVILGFAAGTIRQNNYNGPYMGNLMKVVQASLGSKNSWSSAGLDSRHLLRASRIALSSSAECFVYRNGELFSDLGSRWLNALSKNKVSNSCFGVYWNAELILEPEMNKRIQNSRLEVRIISSQ